jgi:glutamyl-tRNA reductase
MLVAVRATHERLDLGVLDVLTRNAQHLPQVIEELNAESAADLGADAPALAAARQDGRAEGPLSGWVVVATCNRLEVYLDTERFHDSIELVARAVEETSGLDAEHVSLCLDAAMGAPVAEHLYQVIAGLRSIVIGEAEVAGQVRSAFEAAQQGGTATPMLNDLFQIGFRTAKKVTSHTPVGAAGRSGVAIALDRATSILGPLEGKDVLVIGTGAYARLGVAELTRRGTGRVRVHSASGRAVAFARRHGVEALAADELGRALAQADLVLACSGRGTSLFPEQFLQAGPTLVLDLALHSDLHPLVRRMKEIQVLDLSDLSIEVDDAAAPVLAAAKDIVADGVEQFRSRQQFRRVDPAMASLRRSIGTATDAEIARLRRRSEDDEVIDTVERSVRRILAKVMHSPTVRARELAQQGNADEFVEAFHTIFGVDITAGDSAPVGPGSADGEHEQAPGGVTGWMRLDQTIPPQTVTSADLGQAATASGVAAASSAAAGAVDAGATDQPAASGSEGVGAGAADVLSAAGTPSDHTLSVLADLARMGVDDTTGPAGSACPLTPAQQQAYRMQVTREYA